MFVRRKKMAKNTRIAVQIVRSDRQGSRVHQNIVEHVGMVDAKDDMALEAMVEEARKRIELRRFARKFPVLPPEEGVLAALDEPDPPEHPTYGVDKGWCDPEASVAVGIHQVYGALYRELGLDGLLPPNRYTASARALFHTVMARLAKPGSERNNADTLENQLSIDMPLEKIYRMMNHLDETRIKRLKALATVRALGTSRPILDVVFFDCTTLCFESFSEDELRQREDSKDGKRFETQVLLALMVTPEGLPVTYELLPGNRFEGTSLLKALENLRQAYPIRRACVVADRGMMSAANLQGLEQAGMDFVVGAKLRQMPAKRQEACLKGEDLRQLPDGGKLADLPGEGGRRLIVHWSPRRAKKDREDREQLLENLAPKLERNGTAPSLAGCTSERPFLRQSGASRFEIDYNEVEKAKRHDGWHGVLTSLTDADPIQVVEQYHGLWEVETAFKAGKRDLQIRPIFHWSIPRIHAHVAIAFMTLMCTRHLQRRMRLRGRPWSAEALQTALMRTTCSVERDSKSGRLFLSAPLMSPEAREIYRACGLKWARIGRELT